MAVQVSNATGVIGADSGRRCPAPPDSGFRRNDGGCAQHPLGIKGEGCGWRTLGVKGEVVN